MPCPKWNYWNVISTLGTNVICSQTVLSSSQKDRTSREHFPLNKCLLVRGVAQSCGNHTVYSFFSPQTRLKCGRSLCPTLYLRFVPMARNGTGAPHAEPNSWQVSLQDKRVKEDVWEGLTNPCSQSQISPLRCHSKCKIIQFGLQNLRLFSRTYQIFTRGGVTCIVPNSYTQFPPCT